MKKVKHKATLKKGHCLSAWPAAFLFQLRFHGTWLNLTQVNFGSNFLILFSAAAGTLSLEVGVLAGRPKEAAFT